MRVSSEHTQFFVPADRRHFDDVESLLEQARDGFVAQVVEVQSADSRATAQMAPGLDDRALTGG